MDRVSLGHYVIGMEGVALLRTYLGGHKEKAQERIAEIRTFVDGRTALHWLGSLRFLRSMCGAGMQPGLRRMTRHRIPLSP